MTPYVPFVFHLFDKPLGYSVLPLGVGYIVHMAYLNDTSAG